MCAHVQFLAWFLFEVKFALIDGANVWFQRFAFHHDVEICLLVFKMGALAWICVWDFEEVEVTLRIQMALGNQEVLALLNNISVCSVLFKMRARLRIRIRGLIKVEVTLPTCLTLLFILLLAVLNDEVISAVLNVMCALPRDIRWLLIKFFIVINKIKQVFSAVDLIFLGVVAAIDIV